MKSKQVLRKAFLSKRENLTQKRQEKASQEAFSRLKNLLSPFSYVISYVSFRKELDLSLFNHHLAVEKRLLLPKIEGKDLGIYQVGDLSTDLSCNTFGLLEPLHTCKKWSFSNHCAVLVPGLGFDASSHRIGYGKGYYDRFLTTFPSLFSVGVAFQEQFIKKLPISKTDKTLSRVCFF